jgi:hypothetical protein
MVRNSAIPHHNEQKQKTPCEDNLMSFNLKVLCFAGMLPYGKICNTPRKLKLYRAYQISMYIMYIPLLLSQVIKLYKESDNLLHAIEIFAHIMIGITGYICPVLKNWSETYNTICKMQMSIKNKSTKQTDSKRMEILKEIQHKTEVITSVSIIVLQLILLIILSDEFISYFLEYLVGVEHKHRTKPNTSNIYESLLLEKYPFHSWFPFGKKSTTVHLALHMFAVLPVLGMGIKLGITLSSLAGIILYVSVQFKFVNMSLENINNMEDSGCEIQDRIVEVPTVDDETDQLPSKGKSTDSNNIKLCSERSTMPVEFSKNKENCRPPERLYSGNKSAPEDCLVDIIKDHQEAIW